MKKILFFRQRFYLHLMLNKTRVFVIEVNSINIDVTEQVIKFCVYASVIAILHLAEVSASK